MPQRNSHSPKSNDRFAEMVVKSVKFVLVIVKCGVGLFVLVWGMGVWGFEVGVLGLVYFAFGFGFVRFMIVFPVLMKKISRIMVLEMTDSVVWVLVFSSHETGF